MRKRDLGILLLSALSIFFSLQNEGSLSFRPAWVLHKDSSPIKHEAERLPPPVVADLNGDGHVEVVVAWEDKLQVIDPRVSFAENGFSEARVLAEVSLLPDRVRVRAGRRPVALAAGEVKRYYRAQDLNKKVIVVVTAGWNIMCFDHNLKKLWEDDVQDDFPHGSHHKEVAISISNYTLKHGDTGLIIVGGSMEVQPQVHLDPFEEELMAEQVIESHRRSAGAKEEEEDVTKKMGGGKERHFSYYAYAGMTGTRRWVHRSEDFRRTTDAGALQPQHNYRLDASSLATRHLGEVECREFRESVLGVMPHRWEHREDTRFELAHFRKHRRKLVKKVPGKDNSIPSEKPADRNTPGMDARGNPIAKVVGKAADLAVGAKVRKQQFQYVPVITNHTSHWWVPNVVVAHLKEGIEAVHLATGRTVCKLFLPEGGLHADVNGDGVLDHVQAVGGHGSARIVPTGMTEALKPCWAVATSGVPVRAQLFNGTVCRHSPFQMFPHNEFSGDFGRRPHPGDALVQVVAPIILPHPDGQRHRKGSHGDVVFLNSRGEVSVILTGLGSTTPRL
uniref:FG-GAP repeat-containing protein n=1 Tax=Physcomitrium patens TaxID=3218 RepID=A0A7I4D3Y5_PHYPA